MDTNIYNFSNFIEDDFLSIIVDQARAAIDQHENIAKIFRSNNNLLNGDSPRLTLYLMRQNNKSIFSPILSNESSPSDAKSNASPSTPVRSISNITNMPRRYLPLDDAEIKESHPATSEFSTPNGRQKPITQPALKAIINSSLVKTGTSDAQFASPTSLSDNPPAEDHIPPIFLQIAKMIANLNMPEKGFGSPVKESGRIDASSQESPSSSEGYMKTANLARAERELSSPVNEFGNNKQGNQESPRTAKITGSTASLAVDDEDTRKLGGDQIAGNFVAHKDSHHPKENAGVCENCDPTNKMIIHAKERQISTPAIMESETPSPVKRAKICSILAFDTHELSSPAKNRVAENSSKVSEVTGNDIPVDVFSSSPNETIQRIVRDDRKKKSLSPGKKSTTPLKSMPRVVKLDGEERIGIEVIDLDYGASPTTSRSKSAEYESESPKDGSIKKPVVGELNAKPSPKTPERVLHPTERAISSAASETHSPGCDDDVFAGKYQSTSPSERATPTRDGSSKFEYCSEDIAANPILLKVTIKKFKILLDARDIAARISFTSFKAFQTSVNYLIKYAGCVVQIISKLNTSGKYLTEEFKEIVRDSIAIAPNLKKLTSWKKDIEFDINSWSKCFRQIETLKAVNEPLLTDKGEPAKPFEVLQVYENKMKAIWKKMDDMIMQNNSRRALFSHFARVVERLMKIFVKCLIVVGVLQPR